jgi:phosphoglycolate phosphatase
VDRPRARLHLLFDLDGTLTDSSPGILRCIEHALAAVGHDPEEGERARRLIGRPLSDIFQALLGSTDEQGIERAIAAYRTRYSEIGMFENALYPGVADALDEFYGSGSTLQVVTAKPAVSATRVLDHFGIARFFRAVHGPELGDRSYRKADFVRAALQLTGNDPAATLMIGDRVEDVEAAREHGVAAVAVAWGYGTRQELLDARPAYVAESPAGLVVWVRSAGASNAAQSSLAGRT